MTYVDALVLIGGFAVLSFGIWFSIYLYKNEKQGIWDNVVKNRKILFIVSVISLISGYIAALYGMKNIGLSALGAGIILLGVYFLMITIFYKQNDAEVGKGKNLISQKL